VGKPDTGGTTVKKLYNDSASTHSMKDSVFYGCSKSALLKTEGRLHPACHWPAMSAALHAPQLKDILRPPSHCTRLPWTATSNSVVAAFSNVFSTHDILHTIMLGDVSVIKCPAKLQAAGIVAILKCERGSYSMTSCSSISGADDEMSVSSTAAGTTSHEDVSQLTFALLTLPPVHALEQMDLAEGESDGKLDSQILEKLTIAVCFLRRACLRCYRSASFATGRHGPGICSTFELGPRVLIAASIHDISLALTAAAAFHMHSCGEGLYAAALALGTGSLAATAVLENADARCLTAWDKHVQKAAHTLKDIACFRCPYGCWQVGLKDGRLSRSMLKRNPMPCNTSIADTCESDCIGCCLGITGGCTTLLEHFMSYSPKGPIDTLWWAYTTAGQLSHNRFCAPAEVFNSERPGKATLMPAMEGTSRDPLGSYNMESITGEQEGSIVGGCEMHYQGFEWQLYMCSCCGCPTHAAARGQSGPSRQIAIIANWSELPLV